MCVYVYVHVCVFNRVIALLELPFLLVPVGLGVVEAFSKSYGNVCVIPHHVTPHVTDCLGCGRWVGEGN